MSAQPSNSEDVMDCPKCGHHLSMFMEARPGPAEIRASKVIGFVANWRFPVVMLTLIVIWLTFNIIFKPFDPHPMFMLSTFAATLATIGALQGPLILLTQRRSALRDRERDRATYLVSANTERDLHAMSEELRGLTNKIAQLVNEPVEAATSD